MSDKFVPFPPAIIASGESTFTAFSLKVLSQASVKPAFESRTGAAPPQAEHQQVCAEPKISLQRNGDVITGIRIECSCGKVIDLNCVY